MYVDADGHVMEPAGVWVDRMDAGRWADLIPHYVAEDFDGKDCRQQVFDNQTGRVTQSSRPCEDAPGDGVPLGTIHRLNAISKSFSGR